MPETSGRANLCACLFIYYATHPIMNKFIVALVFISFVHTARLQAQIVSFAFSAGSTTNTPPWTNVVGDPHAAVVQATAAGITISSVDISNWSPDQSSKCSADGIGPWPGG